MADHTAGLDVLLVEDNPGDAQLVEHHLGDPAVSHFVDDVTLTHVESLDDAAAAMSTDSHDVLLLDLGLSDSDGLETLDLASQFAGGIPIIVLTGINDRETAMEAIERGAQDYLPKGELDGDRLVRALRYAVVRRRQEQAVEQRKDQLDFFNGILRHDILNGMNVILSRSEMLAEDLDGENERHAETICKWSDDIVELTSTVRSVLRTLTDESGLELETVRIDDVLDDVAERVESMDPDATATVSTEDGLSVQADGLLGDVLGNLATNAVEHGGDEPAVDITARECEGMVRIRVADDGPGIDDERKQTVFDRGEKGGRSSGTGFGLYFVKSMVDAYHGDVWVQDSEAGGAAFVVELRPG